MKALLACAFLISSCAYPVNVDTSTSSDDDKTIQMNKESRWDEGVYTTEITDGKNCLGTSLEHAKLKLFFDPVTYAELGSYPLPVSIATSKNVVGSVQHFVYGDLGIDGRYDLELRLYAAPFTGIFQTRFYEGASYMYPGSLSCESATIFEFDRTEEPIGRCFTCDFDGLY